MINTKPVNVSPTQVNFSQSPYLILWELTRACMLSCRHCRAKALPIRDKEELTTQECLKLLKQFQGFGKPLIVFTGGDPVERPDLLNIVEVCQQLGFPAAITPSATARVTRSTIYALKKAGIKRIAISLDGHNQDLHDTFRCVEGSFDMTMKIISWIKEAELPLQINTTVWQENIDYFDKMAALVGDLRAILWSVFFLVPTGRATRDMQISANQAESILKQMADLASSVKFDVKSTAAPHFRRVLIRACKESGENNSMECLSTPSNKMKLGSLRSYQSVNDGKGVLFVSHTGDIFPSGFLPLPAGNVRTDDICTIYREHSLFKALRCPDLLKGKCGRCQYKVICGGSRARAYAEFGDYLAEDSLCNYFNTV